MSEAEILHCGNLVDIAKDLVEYDVLCARLKAMGDDAEYEHNPKPRMQ